MKLKLNKKVIKIIKQKELNANETKVIAGGTGPQHPGIPATEITACRGESRTFAG